MRKKIMMFVAVVAVLIGVAGATASAAPVHFADAKDEICKGIGLAGGGSDNCSADDGEKKLNPVINSVINLISLVAGIAAVIMIIIGGFKYVTSNGDSSSTKSAKDTILYAIVGLVIIALAQVIVRFVVSRI